MHQILLVEDDPSIADPLTSLLTERGYEVVVAGTVAEADEALTASVALVLLDWRLPDGDGIDLLRDWRTRGVRTPVIVVTARSDLVDRVLGLEHGADDYVVKPFEPRELLARIRARLRQHVPETQLVVGEVSVDTVQRIVRYRGLAIELTRMEYALLRFGLDHPHQVFGRDELLSAVWGYAPNVASRTVDTHVRQLRSKLSAGFIETVRSVGYRFCP